MDGYLVRSFHPNELKTVFSLSQVGGLGEWLFCEPHVWGCEDGGENLEDQTKLSLLKAATENFWPKENLVLDIEFHAENPELSSRNCETCQKYWYNHDEGTVCDRGDGQPMLREPYASTACRTEAGCLKGTPELQIGINGPSSKTIRHFLEWRHVGCPVPRCEVMRANWNIMSELL